MHACMLSQLAGYISLYMYLYEWMKWLLVIGASLSEPYTYRTAVQNPPDIYMGMRLEEPMTFDIGSIQLSFHTNVMVSP